MTLKELYRLKEFLLRVGPPKNPYRDEVIAYVNKDIAFREQQSKTARDVKAENEANNRWPFYGQ